ncbi:MAG: hypothetical protein MJ203_02900 [archaeon]|nr:hypothetical protein [archaeon]
MKVNFNKSLVFILLTTIMIFSISSVNALDVNDSNSSDSIMSVTDINSDDISNVSENVSINNISDSDLSENNNTFKYIQNRINDSKNGDIIEINGTFVSEGQNINIDKSVTIKGSGSTYFDAKYLSGIFSIKAKNVSLLNLIFVNYNSNGAITWNGANGCIVNCTFKDSNNIKSAITWNGANGVLDKSKFVGKFDREGSAITWKGNNGQFTNCVFDYYGEKDSVAWSGNNPYFYNNYAKKDTTLKSSECSSIICQGKNNEEVMAFRRDAPTAATIYVKPVLWGKRVVLIQYKYHSYFSHCMVTSDGWVMGNGGIDNYARTKKLEKIFRKMVEHNSFSSYYLKKIKSMYSSLGHVAIKAPDGRYAVIFGSSYWTGVLKPGEYIRVPNRVYLFKKGKYGSYSSNIVNGAISVAAHDSFGVNRRNIFAYYAKPTTKNGKKVFTVYAYAANDVGKYVGRSTSYFKDNIYFKGKFISKNKLPAATKKLYLGSHVMTRSKVVITRTDTKISSTSSYIVVTLKNSKGKVLAGKKLSIKIANSKKIYYIKTNKKGKAKLKVKYPVGKCSSTIKFTGNAYYLTTTLKSRIKFYPSNLKTTYNSNKKLSVKVLNGKNIVKSFKFKLYIYIGSTYKTVSLVTNSKGIAYYDASTLSIGSHKIIIKSSESKTYVIPSNRTTSCVVKKSPTNVDAPTVNNTFNQSKTFNIDINNNVTNKPVSNLKISVRIYNDFYDNVFNLTTDSQGRAYLDTKELDVGEYTVIIKSLNSYYDINALSKIIISELEYIEEVLS